MVCTSKFNPQLTVTLLVPANFASWNSYRNQSYVGSQPQIPCPNSHTVRSPQSSVSRYSNLMGWSSYTPTFPVYDIISDHLKGTFFREGKRNIKPVMLYAAPSTVCTTWNNGKYPHSGTSMYNKRGYILLTNTGQLTNPQAYNHTESRVLRLTPPGAVTSPSS